MTAFSSAFVTPGSAIGFLDRAGAELVARSQLDSLRSDVADAARFFPLVSLATEAFYDGRFEQARDLSRDVFQSGGRTSWMTEQVGAQGLAEVLLEQPELALVTLTQLEDLDVPFNDGQHVRALAHLALGEKRNCSRGHSPFRHASSNWVFPAESSDAMLMLASVALQQGDDTTASAFLLNAGAGRMPSTRGLARHLASRLASWRSTRLPVMSPESRKVRQTGVTVTNVSKRGRRDWTDAGAPPR